MPPPIGKRKARKRKKKRGSGKGFEAAVTEWWERRIEAGKAKKKTFQDRADEVDEYLKGEHKKFFSDERVQQWLQTQGIVHTSVNLAFQIRGWLAPNLYHRNPTRTVNVRSKDSILQALASVMSAYLNYTPNESGLAEESRKAIDEALLTGRGCLYTGIDPMTGLVTSWQVSIDDILIDPDARSPKDALWVAWRELMPVWRVKEEFGARANGIEGDHTSDSALGSGRDVDEKDYRGEGKRKPEESNDLVEIWRIYSKMGMGAQGKNFPDKFQNADRSDYRLLVVSPDHRRLLNDPKSPRESSWEVPLYLDNGWPFAFLDLTQTRNELWPTSLMGAAMSHQKAIDLLATIWLELTKVGSRQVVFVEKGLPTDAKEQIANGGLVEIIELGVQDQLNGGDIRRKIDKWSASVGMGESLQQIRSHIEWHQEQFAQVTGLLPILKGGGFEVQTRSATEADIKDRNARSRVQDMSERVEDHHTVAARNEGIMLRVGGPSVREIAKITRDEDLGWMVSVTFLSAELPTRIKRSSAAKRKRAEDLERGIPVFPESVGDLIEGADRYYETREEAEQVMPQLEQAAQAKGLFTAEVSVRPVAVEDVWRDTSGISVNDIMRELSYRIEAGSSRRPDHNKMIQLTEMVMERLGPTAMQLAAAGQPDMANKIMELAYDSFQAPPDKRVLFPVVPPPPPPGTPGVGGGQGSTPGPQPALEGIPALNVLRGGVA